MVSLCVCLSACSLRCNLCAMNRPDLAVCKRLFMIETKNMWNVRKSHESVGERESCGDTEKCYPPKSDRGKFDKLWRWFDIDRWMMRSPPITNRCLVKCELLWLFEWSDTLARIRCSGGEIAFSWKTAHSSLVSIKWLKPTKTQLITERLSTPLPNIGQHHNILGYMVC